MRTCSGIRRKQRQAPWPPQLCLSASRPQSGSISAGMSPQSVSTLLLLIPVSPVGKAKNQPAVSSGRNFSTKTQGRVYHIQDFSRRHNVSQIQYMTSQEPILRAVHQSTKDTLHSVVTFRRDRSMSSRASRPGTWPVLPFFPRVAPSYSRIKQGQAGRM